MNLEINGLTPTEIKNYKDFNAETLALNGINIATVIDKLYEIEKDLENLENAEIEELETRIEELEEEENRLDEMLLEADKHVDVLEQEIADLKQENVRLLDVLNKEI